MEEVIIFLLIFLVLNKKKEDTIKTSDLINEKIESIHNLAKKTSLDIQSFIEQNKITASSLKEKFEEEKKNSIEKQITPTITAQVIPIGRIKTETNRAINRLSLPPQTEKTQTNKPVSIRSVRKI